MAFYSYEGVSDDVLDKVHTTSTGETYTLRHSDDLKVEMQYLGKGNSNANSQGWERNSAKYFDSLYQSHPEMFSKKNATRVKEGHAPIVDAKMIAHNPGWEQYRNQPLVHHHIGGDGEAVALPKNAHKGQGEIHNHEKAAGITDNCKSFSKICGAQSDSVGKTTSQLHSQFENNNSKSSQKSSTQTSNNARTTSNQKTVASKSSSREDTVRNSLQASNTASSTSTRSDSVRSTTSSSTVYSSEARSNSVKSSLSSGNTSGHSHRSSSNSASHSASSSGSGGQSSNGSSSHGGSSGGNSQSK